MTGIEIAERDLGALLLAEIELEESNPRVALEALSGVEQDGWWLNVLRGRADFQLGRYAEAQGFLERALGREGEGLALYLDDVPTHRLVTATRKQLAEATKELAK